MSPDDGAGLNLQGRRIANRDFYGERDALALGIGDGELVIAGREAR